MKYMSLDQRGKCQAEYVWIDAVGGVRSKTRVRLLLLSANHHSVLFNPPFPWNPIVSPFCNFGRRKIKGRKNGHQSHTPLPCDRPTCPVLHEGFRRGFEGSLTMLTHFYDQTMSSPVKSVDELPEWN